MLVTREYNGRRAAHCLALDEKILHFSVTQGFGSRNRMSFNGSEYISHIAMRLTQEFAFSAGAGTPGLVGSSKEHPARVQLENLMPEGIGVGSGIVIDSYGGASKQQDIVIFEKICPIFSINGSPDATYYPVEGVIAAGEVKSTLGKAELYDAFSKSASVKKLTRHAVATDDGLGLEPTVSFRNYTSLLSAACAPEEQYDQDKKSLHQIFTFILCEKFGSSPATTIENFAVFCREHGKSLSPNIVTSLQDGVIVAYNSLTNSITRSVLEANGVIFSQGEGSSFEKLLWLLRIYVNAGKAVARSHYERYFEREGANGKFTVDERVEI